MDLNELLEKRKTLLTQLEAIIATGKDEKRSLNDAEGASITTIKGDILNIDKEIEEKRSVNKNKNNNKKMENFSLLKSIKNIVEGRNMDEATQSVFEVGTKRFKDAGISYRGQLVLPMEFRSEVLAGTDNQGKELIATEKFDLISAFRANSVIFTAGARLLSNMQGNFQLPKYSGSNALWEGEVDEAADGAGTFEQISFAPKRISSYIDISKQMLLQDSMDIEKFLIDDLTQSIIDKLENTIFGVTSGTTQPTGLFYNPTYSYSGSTTWKSVVDMETALDEANALKGNKISYIIHPTVNGVAKQTPKVSGTNIFIREGNNINGYPVYTTTNMPTVLTDYKGGIFANWNDLIVSQWGGIDLTVDGISLARYGKIRITINSYWDVKTRRSESFALAALK